MLAGWRGRVARSKRIEELAQAAAAVREAELRSELRTLRPRALQKRAEAVGVEETALDGAVRHNAQSRLRTVLPSFGSVVPWDVCCRSKSIWTVLQEDVAEIIELIVRQPSPRKRAQCAEEGIPLVVEGAAATQRSLAGELEVRLPNASSAV